MNDPSDEERLHDAFDAFLEARFRGDDLDPSAVAGEDGKLRDGIERAARLASWLVPPTVDSPPPTLEDYRIEREVGRGSMGTVFLAHHEKLKRDVALKILPHGAALSGRSRRRFVREARAMANLEDDHIVRVYDVIEQGDVIAYAMEWVDGLNLRELLAGLRARGRHTGTASVDDLAEVLGSEADRIPDRSATHLWLRIGVSMARALQRVHDAGLVHRDVKPANILLDQKGRPLLADFGLVRDADSSLTGTRGFVGTPGYAPPEQHGETSEPADGAALSSSGDTVDHRADIYALGATLYECLAGAPPFAGTSPAKLLQQIETVGAPPLRKVSPRAPRDLEVVLEKAMSPERENRYSSAAEFADDLERVLELKPIHARKMSLARRGLRALRYRHPALVGGTAGAALVLLLAGIWLDARSREARAIEKADDHLQAARELLMTPEVRSATWRARQLEAVDEGAFESAQEIRRRAVQRYTESLDLVPEPLVEVERAAVRLAIDLGELGPGKLAGEVLLRDYPSLALGVEKDLPFIVQRISYAPRGSHVTRFRFPKELPAELYWRFGLIANLLGDHFVCENCWVPLGEGDVEWPLLDVGLARLFMEDGRFGLALPRLQRVVQRFPESGEHQLDLARAYLELEDPGSATKVLDTTTPQVANSFEYRLLRTWAGAAADPEGTLAAFRALVEEHPENADAGYRLACQEKRVGHDANAWEILDHLVKTSPDVSRYRLALARVAVTQGKLECYLDQVRYVLRIHFGHSKARGTVRDLLDILQVGGLNGLYDEGVQLTSHTGSPDLTGLPESSWARPPYGSRLELEERLRGER